MSDIPGAGLVKTIGDVISLIFHPKNIKLRGELRRLASYRKGCAYAQEYMERDDLISSTTQAKKIKKWTTEKTTLRRKFNDTLLKN